MDETAEKEPLSSGSGGRMEGDGATTVGERGVYVGGDVGGDVVTGDQLNVLINTKLDTGAPLQLPPRAEHFTGREDELGRLSDGLRPGRVATIVGQGGMGKSALAAETIWRLHEGGELQERFPDGLLFHTFYNQPEADVAMERIAEAYGFDAAGAASEAARQALSSRTALLVLDGAEDADDLPAVLRVRGGCGVLITTRNLADAPGDWEQLDPLPGDEAMELLREWAGDYAEEEESSRAICWLVGGLPLAVRLVGRYLKRRRQSAGSYLVWLQETPLEALDQGERQRDSVPLLMARSLEQVGKRAHLAMAVVGLLAMAPYERAVLAAALEIDEKGLRRPLDELLDFGLLLPAGDERVQACHALVRTYARKRLEAPEGALERLSEYYRALVEGQNELGAVGHGRLDFERPHLMELLRRLSEQEAWVALLALADPVASGGGYMELSGRWAERIEVCKLALSAARVAGELWQEGNWLNNLANAYADVGRLTESIGYYEEAVTIGRELEDRQGEGATLGSLGIAYSDLGQLEKAIECYERALAIDREIGDRHREGIDLGNLGTAYHDLGEVEKAIDTYKKALAIDREVGSRRGEGIRLGNLGTAYLDSGQVEKAIDTFEQALAIDREIGDRRSEGIDLGNLGNAYRRQGQVEKALEVHQEGLVIAEMIGNLPSQAFRLYELGLDHREIERTAEAREYLEKALNVSEVVGMPLADKIRDAIISLDE